MADVYGAINSPLGSTIGTGVTLTPQQQMQQWLAAMELYNNSPLGQQQNAQQQAANETLFQRAQDELDLKEQELADRRAQASATAQSQEEQNAIDQEYKRGLLEIQRQQFSLDQAKEQHQNQQFYANLGENARQFGITTGMDALKTAASLRGPRDLFQYMGYAAGMKDNPTLSSNVSAWANPYGDQSGYVGPYAGPTPEGASLTGIANDLTGGAAGVGSQGAGVGSSSSGGTGSTLQSPGVQATLKSLQGWGMNPGSASAGFLENKDPTQLAAIQSAIGTNQDWNTVFSQYKRSRLPGSLASAMAA